MELVGVGVGEGTDIRKWRVAAVCVCFDILSAMLTVCVCARVCVHIFVSVFATENRQHVARPTTTPPPATTTIPATHPLVRQPGLLERLGSAVLGHALTTRHPSLQVNGGSPARRSRQNVRGHTHGWGWTYSSGSPRLVPVDKCRCPL